jgi:Ni,Fe-hydrogenase III large subunit
MSATALIRAGEVQPMRPWPRYLLGPEAWRAMAQALQGDPEPVFLGLWADTADVHALFMADAPLLASVRVEAGMFDALSPARPGAAPFERMVHDLWGHLAGDGTDPRPLLDHGCWPVLRPLSSRPVPNAAPPEPLEFLDTAGHDLLQVSIGPIGTALDPMRLRITARGETVVRLEAGLGYAHRGILALMRGKPLHAAASLAARIDGGCTVAHSVAFARAVEAAANVELPPRAHALRGVLAELERIANHLADLGAGASGLMAACCGDLQESVRRASHAAFGHRLMMDCVVPGGVAVDLAPTGATAISAMLDRITTNARALRRGLDGMMGQAVDARLRLRSAEIRDSVALLRQWLAGLPSGSVSIVVPTASGEGLGVADGPRGDVWHWIRLHDGVVATNFVRDPGWLHWPLIETACRGANLSDVPLILRSFSPAVASLEL